MKSGSMHSRFFTMALLLLGTTLAAKAQDAGPESLSAKAFDEWSAQVKAHVYTRRKDKPAVEKELLVAQASVLERLRQEKWTSDEAIMNIVNGWIEFESPEVGLEGPILREPLFPKTLACINAVADALYARKALQAWLYDRQGDVLTIGNKTEEAAKSFQKSLDLVTPGSLREELRRMATTVDLAQSLQKLGDKEKADKLYSQVYSYPWYLVHDDAIWPGLKSLYIEACRGLIVLRRGDLQKLKVLHFTPSTQAELQPSLDDAIQEAEALPHEK